MYSGPFSPQPASNSSPTSSSVQRLVVKIVFQFLRDAAIGIAEAETLFEDDAIGMAGRVDARVRQNGMIASFSRALAEGLSAKQTDDEFNATLDSTIASIAAASAT